MRKFLVHQDGSGPEEIEITDEESPFGTAVLWLDRERGETTKEPHKSYFWEKDKLLQYCSDTMEEALVTKKLILEQHLKFFKEGFDKYSEALEKLIKKMEDNK